MEFLVLNGEAGFHWLPLPLQPSAVLGVAGSLAQCTASIGEEAKIHCACFLLVKKVGLAISIRDQVFPPQGILCALLNRLAF